MSLGFGNNMNGGGGNNMTMIMLGLGVCCVCSSSASALAAGLGWIPLPGASSDPALDAPLTEETGAPSPADTGAPAPPPPAAGGLSNIPAHLVNTRIRLTNVGRFVSSYERMNLAVATPCSDKTGYEQDDVSASREVWKLVPSNDKKAYKIMSERTDSCASKYLVVTKSGTVAVSDGRGLDAYGLWYVRSAGRDEMGNSYFILLNRKFTDNRNKQANALAFSSSRTNPKAYLIGSTTDNKVSNQFGKWVIKRA